MIYALTVNKKERLLLTAFEHNMGLKINIETTYACEKSGYIREADEKKLRSIEEGLGRIESEIIACNIGLDREKIESAKQTLYIEAYRFILSKDFSKDFSKDEKDYASKRLEALAAK
jgi:hypothetical protein